MKIFFEVLIGYFLKSLFTIILFFSFEANSAVYQSIENERFGSSDFNIDLFDSTTDESMEEVKRNSKMVLDLVQKKKLFEASDKVESLIKLSPDQSDYYNLQALLAVINKDLDAAKLSYQMAIEYDPINIKSFIGLSKIAVDEKKYQKAKQYAKKVLDINPKVVNAYKILAGVEIQQHNINAAEQILLDAFNKVRGDLNAELGILQLLGKVYAITKQQEKLLGYAKDLSNRNPKDQSVLSALAYAQWASKDLDDAEQTLRQIISQNPKDGAHVFMLARLLAGQKGREDEVLRLLDVAIHNQEKPDLVLAYKSAFLKKQKQFKQAIIVANQVEELSPKSSLGEVLKGDIYLAEKNYAQALQSYKLAYQRLPSMAILDAIVKVLTIENKQKEAIVLLEKELEKNNESTPIQFMLANLYQIIEDYDNSARIYENLRIKLNNSAVVLNNLALVYSKQKKPNALILAKEAYQKAPHSSAVVDTYGYILLANGYKKESLVLLKQAMELDPNSAEIQLHLVEAYSANNEKSKAKKILQQLIEKDQGKKSEAIKMMKAM
jgi:putative PEP-CTERM system TPR-repeat lipoprotein